MNTTDIDNRWENEAEMSLDDIEAAEMEDYKEIEARQLELLKKLEAGEYAVKPYVEVGSLCNELEPKPGLNRQNMWWDFDDALVEMLLVNTCVIVDGVTFEYDALVEEWINEDMGCVIEEVESWLDKHIDHDYSDGHKVVKLLVQDEHDAEEYIYDCDYYDIDGKLYFFFPPRNAFEDYTDEKRKEDEEMLARATKLAHEEAVKRFLGGDYEFVE